MSSLLHARTHVHACFQIDAGNLWEIERVKQRAMDALRCPPPDAPVNVLSGGERRRVALAKLLLENHDLLLLVRVPALGPPHHGPSHPPISCRGTPLSCFAL